tara:strand:+ start:1687 stop:1878 length:192 start_codon:yes stop_codon:yes gene_type:complete
MDKKFIGYKVVDGQYVPIMEGDALIKTEPLTMGVTEPDLNWRDPSGISQYDWATGRTNFRAPE